ncbi:WD40/YVTN/BNR-like repeat-containing protein [Mangrovitalea sediminis]|uniref:WD40/YVTN/BNR-like repeat-containing protein n=1 Tax=Mangrovitalea sediminis TaxID=1982043 RepID=UPI000BE5DE6B|nr:YCF48-related protein [Mangrovitalea sediminis]
MLLILLRVMRPQNWTILLSVMLLSACASSPSGPSSAQESSVSGQWPISQYAGMRLLDDQHGWLFVGGVFRTSDGGSHWQDLTPAPLKSLRYILGTALDARHAWVAASLPGKGVWLFRTTNAGDSWTSVPLTRRGGPISLQFPDARHGSLLVGLDSGMNHEAVALLTTTDGGAHWTAVAGTRPGYFRGPLMIGPLNDICCIAGVTFKDAGHAWLNGAYGVIPKFYLQVSRDGGRQWVDQSMPLSPQESEAFSQVSPPIFLDENNAVIAASFSWQDEKGGEHAQAVIFHSADGGRTWKPELPLKRRDGSGYRTPVISFVDARIGWMRWGSVLYGTQDGGGRWTALTENLIEPWQSLQFVDRRHGWALSQQTLLETHDGGRHWQTVPSPANASGGS